MNDASEEIKAAWQAGGNFPCAGKWDEWKTIISIVSLKPTLKESCAVSGHQWLSCLLRRSFDRGASSPGRLL
jgi:hypothetical protein